MKSYFTNYQCFFFKNISYVSLKPFNWKFVTLYKRDHVFCPEKEMYLPNNWLVAGITATLLCSVNTLTAHVCLQVAKHRVQLILFATASSRRAR